MARNTFHNTSPLYIPSGLGSCQTVQIDAFDFTPRGCISCLSKFIFLTFYPNVRFGVTYKMRAWFSNNPLKVGQSSKTKIVNPYHFALSNFKPIYINKYYICSAICHHFAILILDFEINLSCDTNKFQYPSEKFTLRNQHELEKRT